MDQQKKQRLNREDWIREALRVLQECGVDGVKVVTLAKRMGVTSGSFYWHFKGVKDLLASLLEFWERELTDAIIIRATAFNGPAAERIFGLMQQVIVEDAALLDHAISVWAQNDESARETFERTLGKRFEFAGWMFKEAGFPEPQASIRGRLMVAYLIGESSTHLKSIENWQDIIRQEFEILTAPLR